MSKQHVIYKVQPDSIAAEMEIEAGDILVSINGKEIEDVFDYHFYVNDTFLDVVIRKADGEEWELEIEKEFDEDLGIEFENGLMDDYKSCTNKCMFCFIDQMPPGMRETLYFKDDDARLSFLLGNYYRFQWASLPNYGFDGFVIASIAGNNPYAVPLAALFLGYLRVGALQVSRLGDIPNEVIYVIQAIIIILFGAQFVLSRRKKGGRKHA